MSDISNGALARMGCLSAGAIAAAEELVARVAGSEVETIRLLFADQHGILRGKTIVASALASAFKSGLGVPSTLLLKDTSHRTVFPVWSDDPGVAGPMRGASDVPMVPDATTYRVLPWSPHSAWLLCDVVYRDGTAIPFSSQAVLKKAVDALAAKGMTACMGLEVEFHVFEMLDPGLGHAQATMPGAPVQTRGLNQGYQYLTETRYNQAEPVLDRIRRMAQGLGMPVRSVEIEMGPSQFEMTFEPGAPLEHAATMVMFRTMVKEVCAAEGLHASFMAKPRLENISANGWHVHQSLQDANGNNLFMPTGDGAISPEASGWIAGLLEHAAESSLLLAPTINGYKRYHAAQLAPNRIAWGEDNRGAMLRALLAPGDPASRVENRAPDSTANPYYAFASQLIAGLDGIETGKAAPPPTTSPYDPSATALPGSMIDAIAEFNGSALYRRVLGDEFVDYLVHIKRAEWARYLGTVSEWEQAEYFNLY